MKSPAAARTLAAHFGFILKFLFYLSVMLAVIPLAGRIIGGSWRAAWRYAGDWSRSVAIVLVIGGLAILLSA